MNKVVIFLPEISFYAYLRTLCCVGSALSDQVYLLHTTSLSPYCKVIHNLDKIPNYDIDIQNEKLFNSAKKKYSINTIEVDDYITQDKINYLEKMLPQTFDGMLSYNYEGFDVGKIAEYDLVLDTKFLDIQNISNNEKQLYKKYIFKALIAAELTKSICNEIKPDIIIAFNPYTINQVACYFAKKNGVDFEYITNNAYKGADYSAFMLSKRLISMDLFDMVHQFSELSKVPLKKQYVKYAWNDSFFRFYGSDGHIFSNSKSKTPREILSKLNLSKRKKTIIAFTSSNDEIIGIKLTYEVWKEPYPLKNVFENQIDWIKFLKDYADSHKDIQIIVRVHPREGNRQNGKPSEHLLLLQKTFTERTDNFVIVWADDPISSYDLLELADLCLVNWSTMGQECARVGIPVLTYTSGSYYVDSKSFTVAKTKQEYEESLSSILNKNYTLDILTDAIRYNFWRNHINAIDCSDTIPHDFNDETVWPRISEEKVVVIKDICSGKTTALEYNKKNWLDSINENTVNEEKEAILEGISEFYNRVFTTNQVGLYEKMRYFIFRCCRKCISIITLKRLIIEYKAKVHIVISEYKMLYTEKSARLRSFITGNQYFFLGQDHLVYYFYKGKKYIRYSPLLYRLGILYKENINKN